MSKVFKWNDTEFSPFEGSVEVTLPDDEVLQPAGSGHLPRGEYTLKLKGAGAVSVRGKGKNPKSYVKMVPDDEGEITWAAVSGDWIHFDGATKDGHRMRGQVFAPDDGPGQGSVNILYPDQREVVKIVGMLEVEVSGAEVSEQTNEAPTNVQFPDKRP